MQVNTPDYDGEERRRKLIIGNCACHLMHDALLKNHSDRIEKIENTAKVDAMTMWDDIKAKVPLKLFYVSVVLLVGALGYLVVSNIATSNILTRIETMHIIMRENTTRIDRKLEKLGEDLSQHMRHLNDAMVQGRVRRYPEKHSRNIQQDSE